MCVFCAPGGHGKHDIWCSPLRGGRRRRRQRSCCLRNAPIAVGCTLLSSDEKKTVMSLGFAVTDVTRCSVVVRRIVERGKSVHFHENGGSRSSARVAVVCSAWTCSRARRVSIGRREPPERQGRNRWNVRGRARAKRHGSQRELASQANSLERSGPGMNSLTFGTRVGLGFCVLARIRQEGHLRQPRRASGPRGVRRLQVPGERRGGSELPFQSLGRGIRWCREGFHRPGGPMSS